MKDMKQLQEKIVAVFIVTYFVLILFEVSWSRIKGLKIHTLQESLAALATGLIHLGLTLIIPLTAQIYFMDLAYSHSLWKLRAGPLQLILAFLLTDLFYYFQHRLNHESDFFWSFHQTHHTSLEFNLFTGVRVSWITPFFAALFLTPIAWFGIRPDYIVISLTLVFYGQWWCHTPLIGRLGFIERLLNTPSSHRVHHSPHTEICRHNYAGVLIIWDRLFGTYQSEKTPVTEFGTSYGFVGYNPFVINLGGFFRYLSENIRVRPRAEQEIG